MGSVIPTMQERAMPTEEQLITPEEFQVILGYLKHRYLRLRNGNAYTSLAVFRLLCLGLRSCEVAGVEVRDLIGGTQPTLNIRAAIAKADKHGGSSARKIQLGQVDPPSARDLLAFQRFRVEKQGADAFAPLVCCQKANLFGQRLRPWAVAERFMTAIRTALGPERARQLSGSHAGRRSLITLSQRKGCRPCDVLPVVGHKSLTTLARYTVPRVSHDSPAVWGD